MAPKVARSFSNMRTESGLGSLEIFSRFFSWSFSEESCSGRRIGMGGTLIPEVQRLPLPTSRLHVSGRKRNITNNTRGDTMDKNQKIDGQVHRIRSKPLIIGATLRGVFRLCALISRGSSKVLSGSSHTILRRFQSSRLSHLVLSNRQ